MLARGKIAIRNNKDDGDSPWKIPLYISPQVSFFPAAVISTLQFSMVSSINFDLL